MKVETDNLVKVSNYALLREVSKRYIYQLIERGTIISVTIDGVLFVDTKKYPV